MNNGENMIITFFGHSDYMEDAKDKENLLDILQSLTDGKSVDFYLGGYGGFDNFALKCCNILKEKFKNVKTIFITPYLGENYIKLKFAKYYYDEIIYPEIENVPPRYAIIKRNKWMVEKADCIIVYVNRRFGGAYTALKHGVNKKKKVINLYQGNFEC